MKKNIFLAALALSGVLFTANAQEAEVVSSNAVALEGVDCKDLYSSNGNWFIQIGAGINAPMFENYLPNGEEKMHLTAAYNVGVGKWFSPYLGTRLSFLGGALHWDNNVYSKSKYVSANVDLMWDMFNSLGGVNTDRVFSIVPFVGIGGTFGWDYTNPAVMDADGKMKSNVWALPVSAGLQFRFDLCDYVDFFIEGRAQMYGDNFNGAAFGDPVDVNLTALGGFTFKLGGENYNRYNPCEYVAYINNLNDQVNALRGDLANCNAENAQLKAQLPCPEVKCPECPEVAPASLMSSVHFTFNSAKISNAEKINVYNVAEWMKSNDANVVVIGYADKNTGSSDYNMSLSERRANAVKDLLVEYGVDESRLSVKAEGSDSQVYEENNWNRIVIFKVAE